MRFRMCDDIVANASGKLCQGSIPDAARYLSFGLTARTAGFGSRKRFRVKFWHKSELSHIDPFPPVEL